MVEIAYIDVSVANVVKSTVNISTNTVYSTVTISRIYTVVRELATKIFITVKI